MPKKKKRRPLKSLKKLQPSIPEVSRFKLGDKPISFHEIKDLTPVFAFNYISLRKTNKCFNCDDIAQKTYHKFFKRLKNISRVYFRELIEIVLEKYGAMSSFQLELLVHQERPWLEAREGLGPTDKCNEYINRDTMEEYYSGLIHAKEKKEKTS